MDEPSPHPAVTKLQLPAEYDLAATLWLAGMAQRDPTVMAATDTANLALQTPTGPVSVAAQRNGRILEVSCLGAGATWVTPKLHAMFGLEDRPSDFQPDGKIEELAKRMAGAHLPKLPVVFHRLVQIVLQQLVSWSDAVQGWRRIVARYGEVAPCGILRLPPTAKRMSQLGYFDVVACGVMPKQARLILRLAREAGRIEKLATEDRIVLAEYLLSIRGIGPWTVQHLLGSSCGDADAVLTGDYGLPHAISYFFTGKERSDDQEMLRLLEPFQGNRFRVINYIWQSNQFAPRRGPKMRTNQWRFTGDRSRKPRRPY